jgi:hypothetical protein
MLGFIFIGGWGDVKKRLVGTVGLHTCPVCHEVSRWDIFQIDKRATVYFMPVFKYSSRKVVVCSHCGNGAEVSELDIANLRAQGQTAVPGSAAPRSAAPAAPAPQPALPARPGPPPRPPLQSAPPPGRPGRPAPQPGAPSRPAPQFGVAPPGTDPALAKWVLTLQGILVKTGYVVQDVRWGEQPYGVQCRVSAAFLLNGTSYLISAHKTTKLAERYAQALEDDPSIQQAAQAGTHLMRVMEKRVLRVHDARGVDAGMLERWVKTVGWYPLP